jgi:MFS family permease
MTEDLKSDSEAKKETTIPEMADPSSPSAVKTGFIEALRIPNYRWLLSGSVLSYAINWIQQILLSWLVYDQTGSGTILGAIVLVMSAASLCMLPLVGLLVDRINRRTITMIDTGCMLILSLGLGLTLLTGHSNIAYLFVFAFMCGLIQTVDSNVRQVLVFDLVPRSHTPSALALNQTGWSVMRFLGPSLGGFLLLWYGAGGSFLVQAGAYLLIGITILQLKLPERKKDAVQGSPMQNIREGISFLVKEPVTRIFTLVGVIMPILIIPVYSTLPAIYAVEVFGDESGRVLTFLMAAVGVGGVIGGVATTYLRRLERWGLLQLASLFLVSLTLIAFAFTSNLPLALALLALGGFFEIIFLTMNMTLIQLSIPDILRSRVTAVVSLTWILSPLGSLAAGAGADLLRSPQAITIIFASLAAAVVLVIMLFSPTVRNYRLSQGISKPG